MESFWTSTPFGISLLASLALTIIATLYIAATNTVRVRAGVSPSRATRSEIAAYLLGYFLVMTIVTYLAIILYWISVGLVGRIMAQRLLPDVLEQGVWIVIQIVPVSVWLGAALLTFRRMFHDWL